MVVSLIEKKISIQIEVDHLRPAGTSASGGQSSKHTKSVYSTSIPNCFSSIVALKVLHSPALIL